MKKNPLIHSLALMAILFAPLFLQAQQLRWQWAVQAHSMGNSRVCGTACDTAGNIYLAGSFSDTIRFGQQTLAPVGDDDLYWVKFDPEGNVLWAHQAGGSGRDMPTAMTVSEAGMIYTAGICGKEAFPQQEKTGMRRINFFLNCHTPAGELQWIKTFGAKRSDQITAIAIDTAGRIYFGGYFEQRLSIGGHQLMAAGSRDAFIVCMDTSGQTTWAKSFGGVGAERITALRVDATSSRVRLLGDSDLSFSLAHTTVTPAAAGDVAVFTALCYADGTIEAVNSRISGPAVDACCIMETSDSLLLVGGNFSDSLAVGTSALYTYGGGDMFIAAIDITGALVWHKQIGSASYDRLFDILYHPWGHIIITGLYSNTLFCDNDTISPSNVFCDVFTASFNREGRLQEINPMGGTAEEFPQVMARDREGHIFVAGLFRDTTRLRHSTLVTPAGSDELFLAKLYHCNKNKLIFSCDTVFTEGDKLLLQLEGDYMSYDWDSGMSTERNYIVTCSKTYQVLVSDSLQCVYSDSITIRQQPVVPKALIRSEAVPTILPDSKAIFRPAGMKPEEWEIVAYYNN